MKIFVGNLSDQTTEKQLETLFSACGEVTSVTIIKDNYTSRSRGFGFVEMDSKENGEKAIEKLNQTMMNGKSIVVNEARPQAQSGRSFR